MSGINRNGNSTSPSLIKRIKAHDRDAWCRLTELYGPLVFHWCRRTGLGGEDAEDVFQQVFATVFKAIDRFDPAENRGTFRGWLWTITRNKIRDHQRYERGRAQAAGGTDAQSHLANLADPFTEDSADHSDQSETASLFHRALAMIEAEFEKRTWQAFWRSAVELHDTGSISQDLGMSPASVRQAKSRVLRRLRRILGDLPESG